MMTEIPKLESDQEEIRGLFYIAPKQSMKNITMFELEAHIVIFFSFFFIMYQK